MGKGQARTKANMRKLAMLEQQNSSNSSVQQFAAVSESPTKKTSRAKTPKNKKSLQNGESMFADETPESAIPMSDSFLGEKSPDKKRRGRKPKNSMSPEEHPVEKKKRQSKSKKSLGVQDNVPMNGDALPVKSPRKPRKKKEVLPFLINPTEIITAPPFQDQDNNMSFLHVEQPKIKSPRSRNKRKKSENLVLEPMPVTNSPEKEYTLQIPEVNDIPTNTMKIVQTIKLPKPEKKGKVVPNNSMQDRKAVLEEEVAQALLDLQEGKPGPPSPLKIVEAPTTMLEIYENTNEVHGIKVKKSLNVIDKKAITPKVKTPKTNKKRKSAVDIDIEYPVTSEPKRKKSGEKKDSSPAGKRKKSTEVKESPAAAKKRKLSEAKEQSQVVKKKTTPKANKARVSRSPKKIPTFPQPETTSVMPMPFQDQEIIAPVEELTKNGKAKKSRKVARLSGNSIHGANNVASNTTPAFGITIAPIFSNGDSGPTVAKVTITSPPQVKASTLIPIKISATNQAKAEISALTFTQTQIPTRATTPAKSVTPQVKATTPTKTSPVKATTPIAVKTSPGRAATASKVKMSSPIQGKDKVTTPVKTATLSAPKNAIIPSVDIETPIYMDVPILVESTPPVKTKATKSNSAKKTANSAKAPRVNTKKKISTSKAKSTTKSLPRTKKFVKDETLTPTKRKAKNSTKGKTTPNNVAKTVSPTPTKSNTTNSLKISKTTPAVATTPPTASKNTPHTELSTPVLDRDSEVTKSAQSLTSKRRSSASSKNASCIAINTTSPASSTPIPVTSGSPMEPESQVLNYLSQPDMPFAPLPLISSITATASKIIKKRNSKSAATLTSYNSADAIISSVSSAGTHLPDLEPIVVVSKTFVPKTNAKNSVNQNQANIIKISPESSFVNDLPPIQIKQEKMDSPKARARRPRRKSSQVIPKPEPFQLNSKPKLHVPTVFVKQSPLGNTAKGNTEKEKHVGPSLRVIEGKVKFYRGSDEEDNETEPKLPREKVPVEFDESVPWTCVFCQLGPQVERLGDLFGPYYVKQDEKKGKIPGKRETWVHEECAVWAHKVLMIGATLRNLDEAVYFGDREKCNICGLIGATVGCLKRGCTKAVHVPCAKTNSWKLDVQTMHSFCPDHI